MYIEVKKVLISVKICLVYM